MIPVAYVLEGSKLHCASDWTMGIGTADCGYTVPETETYGANTYDVTEVLPPGVTDACTKCFPTLESRRQIRIRLA